MPGSRRLPLLAAAAVVLVTCGTLLLPGGVARTPPAGGPPPGAPPPVTLDAADRAALDADPVVRGSDAPAPATGTTFTDPGAVVRAYLVAAHSGTADDAGRTHLRAAPYAVPGTAAADVGVLVLDPPAPGAVRTATVRRLDLLAADRGDRRRGYRATVETRTGPHRGPATPALLTTDVVLARQPDGRWLVAGETAESPDLAVGED